MVETETRPSPEIKYIYRPETAFKVRALEGNDALNPANLTLPDVTAQQLIAPDAVQIREATTYVRLAKASTRERKEFWQGKEGDNYDQQKRKWIGDTTTTFQSANEFFKDSQKGQRWNHLFQHIGINALEFTEATAESIYIKYFTGQTKESNTKQFVAEIISFFKKADGSFDYQKLQENLDSIGWLAHIFGSTASEVVDQLTDAEGQVKIEEEREKLVSDANNKPTGQPQSRLNTPNPNEVRLLTYLWGEGLPINPEPPPESPTEKSEKEDPFRPTEPTTEDPKKFKTRMKRVDTVDANGKITREFPDRDQVTQLTDSARIAQRLKSKNPAGYPQNITQLTQEIEGEKREFQGWLSKIGITPEKYNAIIQRNINVYGDFLKKRYGLNLPEIKQLTVVPLYGKRSEVWNRSGRALGFFHPRYPVLFIDFDVLKGFARGLPQPTGDGITPEKAEGILLEQLLGETQPHEYTHALADIANWHLVKQKTNPDGTVVDDKTTDIAPGKLGLFLVKPFPPKVSVAETLLAIERGRGLMEAVTETLSKQWVEEQQQPPKIPAYKAEIQVLNTLITKISQERELPREKVFKQFVDAYFIPRGFRHLADFLSGKELKVVGKQKRTKKDGTVEEVNKVEIKYQPNRKHFLQIIYALMEYESNKGAPNYELTEGYINNTLTQGHQDEIELFLRSYNRKDLLAHSSVQLTQDAIEEIRNAMATMHPSTTSAR